MKSAKLISTSIGATFAGDMRRDDIAGEACTIEREDEHVLWLVRMRSESDTPYVFPFYRYSYAALYCVSVQICSRRPSTHPPASPGVRHLAHLVRVDAVAAAVRSMATKRWARVLTSGRATGMTRQAVASVAARKCALTKFRACVAMQHCILIHCLNSCQYRFVRHSPTFTREAAARCHFTVESVFARRLPFCPHCRCVVDRRIGAACVIPFTRELRRAIPCG